MVSMAKGRAPNALDRLVWLDQGNKLSPGHYVLHLLEELALARSLAAQLESTATAHLLHGCTVSVHWVSGKRGYKVSLAQVGHSFVASYQSDLNQIKLFNLAEIACPFSVSKFERPVFGSDYLDDVSHRIFLEAKAVGERRLQQCIEIVPIF